MSQTWTAIDTGAAGDTVEDGISAILDRLTTLRSGWSGATAPSGGVVGQLFVDTDDTKFYFLKSTGPDVWEKFLTGTAAVTEGGTGATTAAGARTNLGLGSAALADTGTASGQVPLTSQADARYAQLANNLSDMLNAATARTNLGLGALATLGTVGASQISASAVETAKINDLAVTNAKIANNTIAVGKLANFTASSLVASDSGGSPTTVTIASLQGSRILLAVQEASASTSIDFTSSIDGTYDRYEIQIDRLVPSTDGVNLLLRVSTDGGSSFLTGTGYSWVVDTNMVQFSSGATTADSSDSAIALNYANEGNRKLGSAAGKSSNWRLTVHNPSSTTLQKMFSWEGVQHSSTSYWGMTRGMGNHSGTAAINALRLLMSSGTIASGRFSLFGIK